jgi:signal transduction histidine kinase
MGLVLTLWGPLWLGADLPGVPWGRAALIRVAGAGLLAAACFAAAMAGVPEPVAGRRGLLWFAGGHAVLFTVVALQGKAVWGPGLADWAAGLVFLVATVFGYLWSTAEGDPAAPRTEVLSLFGAGARSSAARLRSAYERQIREVASQEERNRLARDLHDSIKQQIFAIQTSAATAQVRFENDAAGSRQAIEQVRTAAREAMGEMEAMLDQLRAVPLENVGLVEALKKQCEALASRSGAQVEFQQGYLPPSDTLAPGAQQAIFRVAQEALANVARHARAKHVSVALGGGGGRLAIKVEDDGAGFSPEGSGGGMGIANMRARAQEYDGEFVLESPMVDSGSISREIVELLADHYDLFLNIREESEKRAREAYEEFFRLSEEVCPV